MMEFHTDNPLQELVAAVNDEFSCFTNAHYPGCEFPAARKNPDLKKGDFSLVCTAAAKKINPKADANAFAQEVVAKMQLYLDGTPQKLIRSVEAAGPYLNIFLHRGVVARAAIKLALRMGQSFGTSKVMAGKKLIIEHTSSNPNGPLHIGNLRNAILGAHLAELMKSVGYEVEQHFFVNDVGAQIGLTVLGYARLGDMEPTLKIDQWIGMIYAVMNTLSELQLGGINLTAVLNRLKQGESVKVLAEEQTDAALKPKAVEYTDIIEDLYSRQGALVLRLLEELHEVPSIKKASAQLNLEYENNKPDTVKIYRQMVNSCLTGVQQTLDTYNIKHDHFDYESELSWEGSVDRLFEVIKQSPYWVPPTQCNAEGKPEGGHFALARYIADSGLPVGKKGYQKDYPNFYMIRPDGSSLYTFRDVMYSLKKTASADAVFNIIACEQNLPQEKIQLVIQLLAPHKTGVQHHVSYELVSLKDRKMSGRRGIYVLADDLYTQLKDALFEVMKAKYVKKGTWDTVSQGDAVATAIDELATATMKYTLLGANPRHKIEFDVEKVTDIEKDATAPFLLYNTTRFSSLLRKFGEGVESGKYPPLPTNLDEIDFSLLTEHAEWELILDYILSYPEVVLSAGCPKFPEPPQLIELHINRLTDFLMRLVRTFSKGFWSKVKVLSKEDVPDPSGLPQMFARLYLAHAAKLTLENGLRILTMAPLSKM